MTNTDPTPASADPAGPSAPTAGGNSGNTTSTTEANLNFDVLNAADADPNVWGQELGRFLVDLTGKHVDPVSLATLFGAFANQVQSKTYQQAAIAVANEPIHSVGQPKAVLVAQLDLRSDLAELLLGTVA